MNDADLRIGDADRDRAAAELGEHYAQGRIDTDEHAERLDRIWAARTRRELAPVFADLPGHAPRFAAPAYAVTGTTQQRRRFRMPVPIMVLLGILVAVTVLTHLPVILVGLAIWFVASRSCGARTHRSAWR